MTLPDVTPPPQLPPHDLDAEEHALGAMLVSDKAIATVAEVLQPEDFYRRSHATIYQAILRITAEGGAVDSITVVNALQNAGQLDDVGGKAVVHALASTVPAVANARAYAEIVHDAGTYRALIRAGVQIAQLGYDRPGEPLELVGTAEQLMSSVVETRQLVSQAGLIESWATFRDTTPPEVGWVIDGVIPRGGVGMMGAGAKCGKTWLALLAFVCVAAGKPFLGRFVVHQPCPVVYVALEGQRANLRARIGALARGLGVDPDKGDLDLLHVIYKPRINLRDASTTRALMAEVLDVQPGLVGFDVLRKAAVVRESNEGAMDFAEVLANTRPLADAGCAALYPHHNTKANADTDKRPAGERLSGSGALYGHADFGVFITSYDRATRLMAVEFVTRDEAELGKLTVQLTGEGTGRFGGFTYTDSCVVTAAGEHDPAEQRVQTTRQAILEFVGANRGAAQGRLLDGVGGNREAVKRGARRAHHGRRDRHLEGRAWSDPALARGRPLTTSPRTDGRGRARWGFRCKRAQLAPPPP